MLSKYLLGNFLAAFLGALVFFVLMLVVGDMFANIWKYLSNEVSAEDMLAIYLSYAPKCASYALPVSFLFSVSFTLGNLYANNELIAVFASGVSLRRFVLPILAAGALLSAASFAFEDNVVMQSTRRMAELTRAALKQTQSLSRSDVNVIGAGGRIVYHADFYNDQARMLTGVTVLVKDAAGGFLERVNADSASWSGSLWTFSRARLFRWNAEGSSLTDSFKDTYSEYGLDEPPESFRKVTGDVQAMTIGEAEGFLASLRRAGLSNAEIYRESLAEYYRKFSFALTPFIVALISSALGGRFRKNVLLLSLLMSLLAATAYFIAQSGSILLAKYGTIPPLAGAFLPALLFAGLGAYMQRTART